MHVAFICESNMTWLVKDKKFYKTLIALALPISLQNLITFLVNFADNVMVGSLGEVDIAAVHMSRQMASVIQFFMNGIGTVVLVLGAQYFGKKNYDAIKRIIFNGFRVTVIAGILYSVLNIIFARQILSLLTNGNDLVVTAGIPYLQITGLSFFFFCISQHFVYSLRAVQNTKLGMRLAFITLVVNCTLNYLLIFGKFGFPVLGITGAAIATLVARIIECIVTVIYVFRFEKDLKLKLSDIRLKSKILAGDMFRHGIPIMLGEIVWSINTLYHSFIIGRYSEDIMSAFSITIMMSNLIYVWAAGLASSVGIITGKTVGEGKYDLMKQYAKTVQVLFVIVGILSGLLVFFLKMPFISLYNVTDATAATANTLMNVLAIVMAGTCYQMVGLAGLVKSGGDTAFVTINDSIHVFLIIIPSAFIAYKLGAPVWAVFLCLKCDQLLKCIVAVIKINRFKWMKKLVRDDVKQEDKAQ